MPGSSSSPALPARSFAEQVIALGAVAYLEKGADPDDRRDHPTGPREHERRARTTDHARVTVVPSITPEAGRNLRSACRTR
jgi:hypothetical protein